MARQIHRIDSNNTHSVAVVETESGGGTKWTSPVVLQTVSFATTDIEHLYTDARIARNPKFTVIETWKVDGRMQGPNSRFTRTKEALLEELSGHLQKPDVGHGPSPVSTILDAKLADVPKFRAAINASYAGHSTHETQPVNPGLPLRPLRATRARL